jgi:predicted DNA-binding protein
MGGTYDPPERNEDQDDDLKAGEEVRYCIMVVVLASVVISVRIPRELKERLEMLNVNVSEVVRELLERYVEEAEERLLMERLARTRGRLTGKLDPATIAKLVREDRGRS